MTSLNAIRNTLVLAAAGVAAAAAQATTIFDSLTGGQHSYNQCWACTNNPTIQELGDIITFAGTDRALTSVTAQLTQQVFTGTTPYVVDVTFSIYNVDTNTLATSLIAARTQSLSIPSQGTFETPVFDFTGTIVPNTIYYGISIFSLSANADGLRFALWDYWSPAAFGDGQSIPVGTDPGTVVNGPQSVSSVVYGRLASSPSVLRASTASGLGVNDLNLGFTPNVKFIAVAVPEPSTYGLMALGLVAVGAMARRRKQD
jgi:hypothetical protein